MNHDILDQVCVSQAFTATAVSHKSIDTKTAACDPFIGRRMAFEIFATVAAGTGSSHTLAVIQADDADLTSNVEVLNQLPAIAAADLVPGKPIELPIPQGVKTKRYIGIRNTIASGTTTVTLDAYLRPQDEIALKYKDFPKIVNPTV